MQPDHPAHPFRAVVAIFGMSYLLLSAAMVALGMVITERFDGVTRWDVSVSRWFVRQRVAWLDAITAVGSHFAETMIVIGIGLIVVLVLWRVKDWDSIGLIVVALGLEVTVFLTTTLLVSRNRPPVPRLDGAPPTSSFPSGHTAASVALYFALAIVVNQRFRHGLVRAGTSVALIAIPVAVAASRLYRGLHYPTDVFAGFLLGLACLLVAGAAARAMRTRRADSQPTATVAERRSEPTASPAAAPGIAAFPRAEGFAS